MVGPAMKNIDESGSIDYIDRWISGASVKKRPAFMQMIDNIKLQYKTLTNQWVDVDDFPLENWHEIWSVEPDMHQ